MQLSSFSFKLPFYFVLIYLHIYFVTIYYFSSVMYILYAVFIISLSIFQLKPVPMPQRYCSFVENEAICCDA